MRNLWILTEERPKREVIGKILYKFSMDQKITCFIDTIRILPILDCHRRFSFQYEVIGFRSHFIDKIYLKIVSGYSSFVDFLVFDQEKMPEEDDIPIYAIEETKTDDSESRNTGVFQRASKFVYVEHYYKGIKKIMLYNLRNDEKLVPTDTYTFGMRCLVTLGVEILGKKRDHTFYKPFTSVDELIGSKGKMRSAPAGNIPITIHRNENKITISGRLIKNGSLSHDPNIGALSLISAVIRVLGWQNDIVIESHGLKQENLRRGNKFIKIAGMLNIKLDGLSMPTVTLEERYWKYETEGEKLGTVFIHLVVENFTNGQSIFENHAGSEKGYFLTKDGKAIPLEKYTDRAMYKSGDKTKIIHIPDLILIDFCRSEIINIEGKKYEFRHRAIEELKNYDAIENMYIRKYYTGYRIIRTVVLYGGYSNKIIEIEVGFLLNKYGNLILGIKAPEIFKDAIKNLIDFWFK